LLRMSRITDYGIVLLTHLAAGAADPDDPVHNARELAARAGLPLPVVSKILKTLTREGFLLSHRGIKGGYALSRRPEEIERESRCAVRQPWQQINREVRKALERVRLSDLVHPDGPARPHPDFLLLTDPSPVSPPSGAPAE